MNRRDPIVPAQRLTRPPRRRSAAAAVVLAAVLAAGCSHGSGSSGGSAHPGLAKNQARWVLPLDGYRLEDTRKTYGQNLLIAPCMSSAGFEFDVPRMDFSDLPATRNGVYRKLFDVELAKQYGYHGGPGGYLDSQPSNAPLEGAAAKAFDRCLHKAQQVIPDEGSDQQYVAALAGSAYDDAKGADEVRAAAKRWKTCMQPQGVSDLPDSPADFPTEGVRDRFGMNPDPATGEPSQDSASVAEIRLAVTDATCQETSGYARSLYTAEWDLEIEALDRNEQELTRILETKKKVEGRLDDVIEKQGG